MILFLILTYAFEYICVFLFDMVLRKSELFWNACRNFYAFNEFELLACFISQNGNVRLVSNISPVCPEDSSVTVPFGNIWLSPNAFEKVIVFASFAFCILLTIHAGNTFASAPYLVYNVSAGLQLKWFCTICLRRYRVFVQQPHRCITHLQKGNRFHRHRFLTGPARTGQGHVPFF